MGYMLALHLLAQASLAVDCAQTVQTVQIKYHAEQYETNPILGRHPGDAKVVAYFAAHMVVQEAVYRWAPRKLSTLTSIGVLAVEVPTIGKNFKLGLTLGF